MSASRFFIDIQLDSFASGCTAIDYGVFLHNFITLQTNSYGISNS